uniref:Ig-like domain-containing protein n=1 Tax=Panagrolaimus superbus TaxID=310955 RepID=A0A914YLL3_9BILA
MRNDAHMPMMPDRMRETQISNEKIQVKIVSDPFLGSSPLSHITWRLLGRESSEVVYCLSQLPVSQLRFHCLDCEQKNITDMVHALNSAQDITGNAGFPVMSSRPGMNEYAISLRNVDVNTNWTGATIICQAYINGGQIDSAPVTVNVEYLRNVHVVDSNNQSPIRVVNQGNVFYVECLRGPDGFCQQNGRRKTLYCAVQANPPPVSYRWLKNGEITSSNGHSITIGTEMIGKSIQCSANNGLYPNDQMPTSQAVSIEPYSAARLIQTNFNTLQRSAPFTAMNRIDMNQDITLNCAVEGSPRPFVLWRMRRPDGQVVDAACPQGYEGQFKDTTTTGLNLNNNLIRLTGMCQLRISNYSYTGTYWCSACSYVSVGDPECSPGLEAPTDEVLNVMVQGPPMDSDSFQSVEQIGQNTAVVTVPFCAEPMPKPPREIVFAVDNNDIQTGQTWQNFRFDSVTQNNTVPNCYFARLQISPIHEGDKHRQIVLKLQNVLGTKQIVVSLADLLGGGTSTGSLAKIIIFSVLGFIAFLLILAGVVILCIRRQLFCFSGVKEGQYGNPSNHLKTTIGAPETFIDGVENPHGYYDKNEVNNEEKIYISKEAQSPYDVIYKAARLDSRVSSV